MPVTWCAIAYNEDVLAGESWYTRFWCLERVCAYNERARNEYLLYHHIALNIPPYGYKVFPTGTHFDSIICTIFFMHGQ